MKLGHVATICLLAVESTTELISCELDKSLMLLGEFVVKYSVELVTKVCLVIVNNTSNNYINL
jgi:hypothetical protein